MNNNENTKLKIKATKIFQKIEDSKDKLLGDDTLSDEEFVNGLESLMDKIVIGFEGRKKKDKEAE